MSPGSAPALRVVTLNLASGRGADGAPLAGPDLAGHLSALAALSPDVVCLQEVDLAQPRSASLDQAALVAGVVGAAHWRFAPALSGTPGLHRSWEPAAGQLLGPDDGAGDGDGAGDSADDGADDSSGADDSAGAGGPRYGIALLSRAPVASWHVLALGSGRGRLPLRVVDPRTGRPALLAFPDEPRVAVAAVLAGGTVVACTHLSFAPVTAVRQLRRARTWLAQVPSPAGIGAVRLLAGDLNLPGPVPGPLAGGRSLVRGATYPASAPRLQLDHVLSLGAAARGEGSVIALPCGDHRAVVADVLPGPRVTAR